MARVPIKFEHENEVFFGEWWRPELPDDRIVGRASWNRSGWFTIEFIGAFKKVGEDEKTPSYMGFLNHCKLPVLYGESQKGDKITVYDLAYTSHARSSVFHSVNSVGSSGYSRWWLSGVHVDEEEFLVEEVTFKIPGLWEWIVEPSQFRPDREGNRMTISVDMSKPLYRVTANTSFGKVAAEAWAWMLPSLGADFSYRRSASFTITFDPAVRSVKIITHWTRVLVYLLRLGTLKTSGVDSVSIEIKDLSYESKQRAGKSIEIFHASFPRKLKVKGLVLPGNVPFVAWERHIDLSDMITNWVKNYEPYRDVYDQFFGAELSKSQYKENQFLHYMKAIESYVAKEFGEEAFVPEAEFKAWRKSIIEESFPENFPKELRSSIKAELSRANKKNLKKSIRLLFDTIAQDRLKELFRDDVEKVISRLVDMRHYFAHGQSEKGDDMESYYDDLFLYTNHARAIAHFCLLRLANLEEEKAQQILVEHRNLLW